MTDAGVTVEPLTADHFEAAAGWLSRPSINRWLSSEWRGRPVDATTLAITVRNKRNRLWLVRTAGTPCGLAALSDVDLGDRTAMLWYLLGDARLAGRGITSAAVRIVLKVAFEELNLSCVYAWIMADNTPSRHVLESTGFSEAGRIRRATNSGGKQVDRVYFDITRDEPLHPVPSRGTHE